MVLGMRKKQSEEAAKVDRRAYGLLGDGMCG